MSCLPACVWAVLTYRGEAPDYDQLATACLMDSYGAVDELAAQGLREAGWDVTFVDQPGVPSIHDHLSEDSPLIALLPVGTRGHHSFAHAVVVCGLDERTVTLMDPAIGDYIDWDLADFERSVSAGFRGLHVAGGPGPSRTV